jgi:hypothetical protein
MKTLLETYTFTPSSQQITFPSTMTMSLEQLLLITNTTTNTIIYNFADPSAGGALANNVLTLDFNTTAMSSSDKLQIYFDNQFTPASDELVDALYELINKLGFLPSIRGVSADLRVTPISLPTLSTVTTVSTVSNHSSIGGYNANTYMKDIDNTLAVLGNINNVTV